MAEAAPAEIIDARIAVLEQACGAAAVSMMLDMTREEVIASDPNSPFMLVCNAVGLDPVNAPEKAIEIVAAIRTRGRIGTKPLQARVEPWMTACFGPEISADKLERGDRLIEEVLELLQSGDYPRERIAALTEYTYSRPQGEPHQEAGCVMITLAAYCLAHGLDMHMAGEDELARVWTKIDKIRAKQAAKPTGSALPVAPDNAGRTIR